MSIIPRLPLSRSEYLRTFEAEIDVLGEHLICVRGRLEEYRVTLEHEWFLRTPEYEVVAASARQSRGDEDHVSPELCNRYPKIKGVRIGQGFSKRIKEALGQDLPGHEEHLLLAIEMARVGQQVFQFSPEFLSRFSLKPEMRSTDALLTWEMDRAYLAGLPNSCYTYLDANAEQFREREIVSHVGPDITQPKPGTQRAFWRKKHVSIRQLPGEGKTIYVCESGMQDSLHDIVVRFNVSSDGTISDASSVATRLPYTVLCEHPQTRVGALNGMQVTNKYVAQLAETIGGSNGCTHMFDLSIDCLRLFLFN